MPPLTAQLYIDVNRQVGEISPLLFGGFAEHMGRCIYGGIYDPARPTPVHGACAQMCWRRCATSATP